MMDLIKSKFSGNKAFAGGNGNNRATQPLNARKVFINGAFQAVTAAAAALIVAALI